MFLRREGRDAAAQAVAFGSHLDTVPTGGRFDGVFGVLAGLEVMRALDEAGILTRAPLELVNWTNEEGSRFRPAMMGSRVHAADMVLEDALAITDDDGISVRDGAARQRPGRRADPVPARLGLLAGGAYRAGSGDGGDRRRYRHRHRHRACALFPAHRHRRAEPCRADHDGPPARQPGRGGGDHPGGGAHRARRRTRGPRIGDLDRELPQRARQRRQHHPAALRRAARTGGARRRHGGGAAAGAGSHRAAPPRRDRRRPLRNFRPDRVRSDRSAICCATRPRRASLPRAT